MSVIANLKVMLSADSAELKEGFKKADKSGKKWAKAQERRNKQVADSFRKVAAGVAAGAGALAAASVQAVKYADNLAKSSRTLGISVEQLQEYTFAAERSGVSTDEMVKGLQQFNKFVGQAARGTGTAKKAFEDMGIPLKDISGNLRSSNVLIDDFVEKMSDIESPAMRAGLAADVFGRAGVKLLPMMGQGKEGLDALRKAAASMGNVMSNETAAKAEILNDKLDTFTKALETKLYTALVEGTDKYLPAIVKALDILEGTLNILKGSVLGLNSLWHLFRAAMYSSAAAVVSFGRSIGLGLAHGISVLPQHFKLAAGHVKLGIANMVHAAASAGDSALKNAPSFVKQLFGYEDGSASTASGALVEKAKAEITAATTAISELQAIFAQQSEQPSILETSLMGSADKAIETAVAKAREGTAAIFGGVAMMVGDQDGSATTINDGVDSLGSGPAKAGEEEDPTAPLQVHWNKFHNGLKDQQDLMKKNMGKSWGDIAASFATNLGSMGKAGKAFAIGQTVWNTSQAIMAAMSDKSVPNFYMRLANAGIAGVMGAQAVGTIKGQAHDGIDNVPSTGTYLLEKGERVVDSRLNGDLKDALSSGGGMGGQSGTQNITFAVTGVEDPDVINRVIQENRGEFESMLRQINSDRAGQGLL